MMRLRSDFGGTKPLTQKLKLDEPDHYPACYTPSEIVRVFGSFRTLATSGPDNGVAHAATGVKTFLSAAPGRA
jgi:hypothetical protein